MIEKEFISTFEEWSEGQTLWCKRQAKALPYAKLVSMVATSLWALAGASAVWPPHWPGYVLFAILVALHLLVKFRQPRVLRWSFERDPDRGQPARVRLDEQGYSSWREGLTECKMTWQSFSGWIEGSHTIILGRHGKYCFLPKRVLSKEELVMVRELCKTQIRPRVETS